LQIVDFADLTIIMSSTTHLMTAEELIALPSGQHRYELVKGELLTMSPSGEEHGRLSATIALLLGNFVRAKNLGIVYGAEAGFKLETNPDTVLAPDAAFINIERAGSASKGYRSGPPDLAVEIISPSERKSKVEQKTNQWLSFGARAVWLIYAQNRTVEIVLANGERTLFTEGHELVDDVVVKGFRVLVAEIFSQL
jgi:Uma2 family endonuclease